MHDDSQFDPDIKQVLVADDDPGILRLLVAYLEARNHEVLTATNGKEAWELFQLHEPRLVITDWDMPGISGLELCARIRSHKSEDYTFVMILTGQNDREGMVKGFATGADDYVTKPFDRAEVVWRVYSGMRVLSLHNQLKLKIEQIDEAKQRIESANQEMKSGLMAAARAQRALLPKCSPNVENVEFAWSYTPSDHLGGDSLNVYKLSDDKVGFFLSDVAGHGVASALLAVTVHRVMSPNSTQFYTQGQEFPFEDPGRILTDVNQRLPMSLENGEYFTAVSAVIDLANGELRYSGAGHPYPLIITAEGELQRLSTDGLPVGFDPDNIYETQIHELSPGARVCFYSDGIIEASATTGEQFGEERLADVLAESRGQDITTAVETIRNRINEWSDGTRQSDDISILLMDFAGKLENCHELQIEDKTNDPCTNDQNA